MVLTILSWNVHGLIMHGQECKKDTFEMEKTPDVICVQETWLVSTLLFNLLYMLDY